MRRCRTLELDVEVSDEADIVELEDRACAGEEPVDGNEEGALEADKLGARSVSWCRTRRSATWRRGRRQRSGAWSRRIS